MLHRPTVNEGVSKSDKVCGCKEWHQSASENQGTPKEMIHKVLIVTWAIFSLVWSSVCIFALFLGAGMSVGDSNTGIAFLAYWLGPILVPLLIYKLLRKRK